MALLADVTVARLSGRHSTRPIVYLALSLAKEYNFDLRVDHWTAVKIILRGLRKYFSVMEVIKSSS